MNGDQMWQVQVRSQMHDGSWWNEVSDHSAEVTARQAADRYQITHPARQYRILRFVVAEIIDLEVDRPDSAV